MKINDTQKQYPPLLSGTQQLSNLCDSYATGKAEGKVGAGRREKGGFSLDLWIMQMCRRGPSREEGDDGGGRGRRGLQASRRPPPVPRAILHFSYPPLSLHRSPLLLLPPTLSIFFLLRLFSTFYPKKQDVHRPGRLKRLIAERNCHFSAKTISTVVRDQESEEGCIKWMLLRN